MGASSKVPPVYARFVAGEDLVDAYGSPVAFLRKGSRRVVRYRPPIKPGRVNRRIAGLLVNRPAKGEVAEVQVFGAFQAPPRHRNEPCTLVRLP